jgi:hypothetical protein
MNFIKNNWVYLVLALLALVVGYFAFKYLPYIGLAYLFEKTRRLENKVSEFQQKDPRSRR